MTDDNKLSNIEIRADELLKDHNGVYLEKKLYMALKREIPGLSRADFREVLNKLLQEDYVLEHGLIRPLVNKESKKLPKKYVDDTRPGKGASETQRIPDKRI
jgi:hypothetical protein